MIYTLEFDEATQKFSIHHQKSELKHGNIPTKGIARSNDLKELQYFAMLAIMVTIPLDGEVVKRETFIEVWKQYKERLILFPKE